jgi:hypothetical protein
MLRISKTATLTSLTRGVVREHVGPLAVALRPHVIPDLLSADCWVYRTIPCWATAMLSRVEFFTLYIISSAWRMISWVLLASSG